MTEVLNAVVIHRHGNTHLGMVHNGDNELMRKALLWELMRKNTHFTV